MNARQKKILTSWRSLFQRFVKREWFLFFMSSGLGVVVAESVHLLWVDRSFQYVLVSKYKPAVSFDDPRYYIPYIAIVLILMFIAVSGLISSYAWRGLKSFC